MPVYHPSLGTVNRLETKRYAGIAKVDFNDNLVDKVCLDAQLFIQPQSIWQIYDYHAGSGTILTDQKIKLIGTSIVRHLTNAKKIIILSATIGKDIEKAVDTAFQNGEYAYALLLDAAGTAAVEATADATEKMITASIYKEGFQLGTRFSPGYGDWDIHFQPEMLRLADAATIGVTMTESYMLNPRKSITAAIGLHTTHGDAPVSSCASCKQQNCLSRKESTHS